MRTRQPAKNHPKGKDARAVKTTAPLPEVARRDGATLEHETPAPLEVGMGLLGDDWSGENPLQVDRLTVDISPGPSDPLDTMDLIFGHARPDSLIVMAQDRPEPGSKKYGRESYKHWLAVCTVEERRNLLPGIFRYLTERSQFLAVNPFGHSCLKPGTPLDEYRQAIIEQRPKMPFFDMSHRHVRDLTAICVDLDCYKVGIPAWKAVSSLMDKAAAGEIPTPSMLALSGRGVYVLYLLADTDSQGRPVAPEATPRNRDLWQKAADGLLYRLQDLNPDTQATKPGHLYKRPGTVTRDEDGTPALVGYLAVTVRDGISVYSLPDLIDTLSLPDAVSEPARIPLSERTAPPAKTRKKSPNQRPGQGSQPYAKRIGELEKIAVHRNGITCGHRHTFLMYYWQACKVYYAMRCPDIAHQTAKNTLSRMNLTYCHPPLSPHELIKCMNQRGIKGRGYGQAKGSTVASALGVTVREVEALALTNIVPLTIKIDRERASVERKEGRQARLEDRQRVIIEGVKAGRTYASMMVELCITERTIKREVAKLRKAGLLPDPQGRLM